MTASCGLNKNGEIWCHARRHSGEPADDFECSRIVAAGGGTHCRPWSNLD
jgi:hypothetical protein